MRLNRRLKITALFVLLVSMIQLIVTCFCGWFLQLNITTALDEELSALESEILPFIATEHHVPKFDPERPPSIRKDIVISVSLFDRKEHLVSQLGPYNNEKLLPQKKEVAVNGHRFRQIFKPLISNGAKIGWLRIAISTRVREIAMHEFFWISAVASPILLLGLLAAGYFFAGKMVRPIEESFSTLKRFMTDASHELKTPVAIARINTEALEQELLDKNVSTERTAIVVRSLERMTQLIDDITLLSNMENPSFKIAKTRVGIDSLVTPILSEFSEHYKQKGVDLQCQIDAGLNRIKVLCAPELLERALTNLLANALRYTSSGGTVCVAARDINRCIQISVADTGIGIPHDALPMLFERFYRVDESRSHDGGGSGLGLAIVKAAAEANGGKVEVSSVAEKGSVFTISLPLD